MAGQVLQPILNSPSVRWCFRYTPMPTAMTTAAIRPGRLSAFAIPPVTSEPARYTANETTDREVVSIYTIRAHTRSIYAKLDVHSKKELTALVQKQVDQAG